MRSTTQRGLLVLFLAGCFAFACGPRTEGPAPVEPPAFPPHSSAPRLVASAPPAVTEPPVASAPPVETAEPEPPSVEGPVDLHLGKGTIACGKAACTVGKEVCCSTSQNAGSSMCRPLGQSGAEFTRIETPCIGLSIGDAPIIDACDDGGDCEKGFSCCAVDNGGTFTSTCTPNPAATCDAAPRCRPGSACPAGLRCGKRGLCMSASPSPVPCGTKTCSGATPVCCMETAAEMLPFEPRCVAEDGSCRTGDMNHPRFECTSSASCGPGLLCCGAGDGGGSRCRPRCGDLSQATCSSDSDCKGLTPFQDPPGIMRCRPVTSGPKGLQFCREE